MFGVSLPPVCKYKTNNTIFDYSNPRDLAVMAKTSSQYDRAISQYIQDLGFGDFKDYKLAFNPCVKILGRLDPLGNKNKGNIFDRCCRLKENLPNHPESPIARTIIEKVEDLRNSCKKPGIYAFGQKECVFFPETEFTRECIESLCFHEKKFELLPEECVPIISRLAPLESLAAIARWENDHYLKSMHPRIRGFFTQILKEDDSHFSGGHREGDTPDPFPNSEVKPLVADGTIRKSMGE